MKTEEVKVYPQSERCNGNIMWQGKFPMSYGVFPKDHPVSPGKARLENNYSENGNSECMQKFRALGYWASCFPEGDGIVFKHEETKTDEQLMADVRECFPMFSSILKENE